MNIMFMYLYLEFGFVSRTYPGSNKNIGKNTAPTKNRKKNRRAVAKKTRRREEEKKGKRERRELTVAVAASQQSKKKIEVAKEVCEVA